MRGAWKALRHVLSRRSKSPEDGALLGAAAGAALALASPPLETEQRAPAPAGKGGKEWATSRVQAGSQEQPIELQFLYKVEHTRASCHTAINRPTVSTQHRWRRSARECERDFVILIYRAKDRAASGDAVLTRSGSPIAWNAAPPTCGCADKTPVAPAHAHDVHQQR